jgi:carbon monoxide dehydrogenase subunit G
MKAVWALAVVFAFSVGTGAADAHGPTRQKLVETIEIGKPVDKVWAIVKDFDALAKWLPIISSSKADKGNEVGSVRTLVVKAPGDPQLQEELLSYDPDKHSYHYEMKDHDPKILPVANYTSWITVKDDGKGGSLVEWKGAYYRGDQRNDPPPELNDDAANAAVKGIYRAGLDNLKKIAEGQ